MKKLLLLLIIPFLSFGQTPITQENIFNAAEEWVADPVLAEKTYGHISDWDVSNVTSMEKMFYSSGLSINNYDALLIGWSQLELENNVLFGGFSQYCNGADARQYIIDNFNWDIIDGGYNCDGVSIDEESINKNLITTIDILGRETNNKGFQLHIYDDGSVEKKYVIK